MGLFPIKPRTEKEAKLYNLERTKANAANEQLRQANRSEQIKAQARFDSLPRTERAKIRLQAAGNFISRGANKLVDIDRKLDLKARESGHSGGVIQNGYKRDLEHSSNSRGLLVESLREKPSEGLIVDSLRGKTKIRNR